MVRLPRAIRLAAGVILVLAASPVFGAEPQPVGSPQEAPDAPRKRDGATPGRGGPEAGEARLDAVRIVGAAEHPAVLFVLPRGRFRLLPLRPEPDPPTRILQDDKLSGEAPGS